MESPASRFAGRVLLVEDNSINRLIARRLLERLGLQIDFADDGAEALERLAAVRFDLVLMDCVMPRLDGFAATQRWRELEVAQGRARTPIVAVTANSTTEDRTRCLASGMDDVLAKPINLQSLTGIVARYLRSA
ncbi:MAG TPA: response regulator [Burkholderiaceae bacterium]|nr:response regulator [Burkholderiaceae bacterium]